MTVAKLTMRNVCKERTKVLFEAFTWDQPAGAQEFFNLTACLSTFAKMSTRLCTVRSHL